jgi:hypothetical protein
VVFQVAEEEKTGRLGTFDSVIRLLAGRLHFATALAGVMHGFTFRW